jgi:HIRAN domain.
MKEAWNIKRKTILYVYSMGTALKLAWMTIRSRIRYCYSKVRGTSFKNHQKVIKKLLTFNSIDILLTFIREPDNLYDSNAIRINAFSKLSQCGSIGYVSKELAAKIAPLIDAGHIAVVKYDGITGTDRAGYLGCNFRFTIIEKAAYTKAATH